MQKILFFMLSLLCTWDKLMAQAECCTANGTFLTEQYNSQAGWTFFDQGDGQNNVMNMGNCSTNSTQNGGITIANGRANFNTLRGAREIRLFRSLPATLSNTNWTADFMLTITPTPTNINDLPTNNPSVYPIVFNNDGGPITTGSGCGNAALNVGCTSYSLSSNNAIAVLLDSPHPNGCNGSNPNGTWTFRGFAKLGSTSFQSNAIPLTANTTYYIRLQRVTAGFVRISVFSDPGFCNHIPQSPQCFSVDANINGLSFMQHEVGTGGSWRRVLNGSVSNVRVDNNSSCGYSVSASPDITVCTGQVGNVTIGNPSNPTVPGYIYNWLPTTNIVGPTNGPSAVVNNVSGGQYVLSGTLGGCPFTDSVWVQPPLLVTAGADVMNCMPLMQSAIIGSSSNPQPPAVTYMWTSSNPAVTIGSGGGGAGGATGLGTSVITLTATDQYGCTITDQLNYMGIQVDAGPDRTYCFFNNNSGVMIGGNTPELPGYTYSWTSNAIANAGINCNTCPRTLVRPTVNANFTFNYVLTVTSPWGAQCCDTVRVTVLYKKPNTYVSLPASYTVNCSTPSATLLTPSITTANSPIINYDWKSLTYPSVNNLSNTTVAAPSFTNCNNGSNPATFFITVTDNVGCQASAKTNVSYVNAPPMSGGGNGGGNSNRSSFGGFVNNLLEKTQVRQNISGVRIFPVPSKGKLTIQSALGKRIERVVVKYSDGKQMLIKEGIRSQQTQLHLKVINGTYLVEVWTEGEAKPIIQKVLVSQ